MTRITISLPDDLAASLSQEARRRRESVSGLVREALRRYLEGTDAPPPSLGFIALGRSGRRHTARDAEKILNREWGRDRSR
jgi:Arc/MetJ-type ribon-helix-helix transcriptional regulator